MPAPDSEGREASVGREPGREPELVDDAVRVVPVIPPVAATEMTLEDTDSAAVTGQIVVASCTTSVTSTVDTCSGAVEASSERDEESAGQLVTVGAQLMTVRTWVDSTVRVVSCSEAGVGTVPLAARGAALL